MAKKELTRVTHGHDKTNEETTVSGMARQERSLTLGRDSPVTEDTVA